MKKALSVILSMLMLLSVAPMAFAEVIANADAPIAIAADAETTIELEQYNTGELTKVDGTTESFTIDVHEGEGKSYLYDDWIYGKKLVQTLTVSAAEAGTYDVEAVFAVADHLSAVSLVVNGTTVPTFSSNTALNTTTDEGTVYYFDSDFPAYKKTFRVELAAGDNKLSFVYPERGASVGGGIALAADYVKFIPVENTVFEIGESGTTTIEMETLTNHTKIDNGSGVYVHDHRISTVTETAADGSTVTHELFGFVEKNYNKTPLVMTIPINVEKAGWYDVNAYLSKGASYLSVLTLNNQTRGKYFSNATGTNANRMELLPYKYLDQTSYRYEDCAYLPAGEQNLTLNVATRLEAVVGGIWFYGDKITLTPVEIAEEDYAVISANGGVVEYENYTDYISDGLSVNVRNETTNPGNRASNSSYIQFDTNANRTHDLYIDIPVTVEKSGLYDVELIASTYGTRFYVDEAAVSLTRGSRLDTKWSSNLGDYYCMQYYSANPYTGKVYLTAGDHVFTTISERRADNKNDVANALDCIKFTAVENTASYFEEDNSVFVEANTETVSGTAVIALYNGKELVGTFSYDVTDEELISGTVYCTKKPDTAKVFVWDSMETISPAMAPVIITVE